jgi:SAM-dependent methyltransferase
MTTFRNPRTLRVAARQLAEAMQRDCPADRAFDQFLPERLRVVSAFYWSPLPVAQRAAEWFTDAGVRTVVDIGSGAGKFCVAAALFGRSRFIGLERRPFLVQSARALARLFDVNDRVRFVDGGLGAVPTPIAEAYYFFNPFGSYSFGVERLTNMGDECSEASRAHDVAAAEHLLRRAAVGTWVVTFNGFGGRIPEGYDLARVDWELPAALRMWKKTRWRPSNG